MSSLLAPITYMSRGHITRSGICPTSGSGRDPDEGHQYWYCGLNHESLWVPKSYRYLLPPLSDSTIETYINGSWWWDRMLGFQRETKHSCSIGLLMVYAITEKPGEGRLIWYSSHLLKGDSHEILPNIIISQNGYWDLCRRSPTGEGLEQVYRILAIMIVM